MGKKKDVGGSPAESSGATVPTEKMTQRQAVTRALAAGRDQPTEGVAYIKETFDLQLTNQSFSTLKSQIKKAARTNKLSARTRAAVNGSIKASNGAPDVTAANPAELARGIKALVALYGAVAVKQMVDVFAD